MDLIEQYGELAFGLDFYLQVGATQRHSRCAAGRCQRGGNPTHPSPHIFSACFLPCNLVPLAPPLQAQGLSHLADAMEGSFPPRYQRMTEELCEVRVSTPGSGVVGAKRVAGVVVGSACPGVRRAW